MGQRLSRQENLQQRRTSSNLSIKIDSEVNKSVEEFNNSKDCLISEHKSIVITIRMIKMEPIINSTAGQSDNSNMDEKDGQSNLCNNLNNNTFSSSSSSLNKLNNLNICDQQSKNNLHILDTTTPTNKIETTATTTTNSELNNNDSIIKNDLNKLNSCVNFNKLNNLNFNIMDERFNHLRLRNNYDDDFKPQSVINSFNIQNNNNNSAASSSSSSNTNLITNTFNIPNYGSGGSVSVVDKDTIHNKCDAIEGTSQTLKCSHINCRRKTIASLGQSKKSRCKVCRTSSLVDTTTLSSTDQSTKDPTGKQKKNNWSSKLMCAKLKGSKSNNSVPSTSFSSPSSGVTITSNVEKSDSCICTSYRKSKDDQQQNTVSASSQTTEIMGVSSEPSAAAAATTTTPSAVAITSLNPPTPAALIHQNGQIIRTAIERTAIYGAGNAQLIVLSMNHEFQRFNNEEMPIEDCDERARLQRALEIDEGVDPPPGYMPNNPTINPTNWTIVNNAALQNILQNRIILQNNCELYLPPTEDTPRIHSQVDYIHCLVPDLEKITSCGFYWGKMDRYEAERLLDQKPEGTFLLRDSAQDEYLFSVSFRKYGRSLHARIEQFNHKFSFDSHDPGVFTANTVTGLLEHYKDPSCVMFFEPMLTQPLNRNFSFSLQQLCRATIVTNTSYDAVNDLCLPKTLKAYLKEYHYKQRVRVRKYEEHANNC